MSLDARVIETLSAVTTATITTLLLKKGLRNVWMLSLIHISEPTRPY